MIKTWPILMLVSVAFAGQSQAANNPGAPGVAVATGTCSRLITGADDYSARCDNQMGSVTLADGTVTFVFTVGGVPIGFSGDGKQTKPGLGGAPRLPITFVAVGENASQGALKADGSCTFGDPFKGPATVICMAQTEKGPFLGVFKTDGSQPTRPAQ